MEAFTCHRYFVIPWTRRVPLVAVDEDGAERVVREAGAREGEGEGGGDWEVERGILGEREGGGERGRGSRGARRGRVPNFVSRRVQRLLASSARKRQRRAVWPASGQWPRRLARSR